MGAVGWSSSSVFFTAVNSAVDPAARRCIVCAIGGNSYDIAGLLDDAGNELFGGPGNDYLVGDQGNDRLDGGPGYDYVQPGYRDGRIDRTVSTEHLVDGCLGFHQLGELFKQPGY